MSIKYAEITIIRNLEEQNIFTTLTRYFGYENQINNNDTIIMTFDDGTICDIKDEYKDLNYKFGLINWPEHWFPGYFDLNNKITLFYKRPKEVNGVKKLDFKPIFNDYKNHYCSKDSSKFNMIYEDYNKKEKLAICRVKSNEDKPRFLLAYDIDIFDRSDIIYLVDCIFKRKYD